MKPVPKDFATRLQVDSHQLAYLMKADGTERGSIIITKVLVQRKGPRKPGQTAERVAFNVFDEITTVPEVIALEGRVNKEPMNSFNEALTLARTQVESANARGWLTFKETQSVRRQST